MSLHQMVLSATTAMCKIIRGRRSQAHLQLLMKILTRLMITPVFLWWTTLRTSTTSTRPFSMRTVPAITRAISLSSAPNACHTHDWLVEIHGRFECMSETLILDRCLLALAAARRRGSSSSSA